MKKMFSLMLVPAMALFLFTGCGGGNPSGSVVEAAPATETLSGNVLLNGSTSVERVVASLIEAFNMEHPGVILTFNPTGSGAGITSATEGTADIGFSSRQLRDNETGVDATVFAIDGIALVIHNDNPVTDLSLEQIAGIFTGEITNWNEVGGNDSPITPIGREAGSGTRDAFESIIGSSELAYEVEITSGGAAITFVSTNPFAIGYSSLSAVNDAVRVVSVNGVPCTEETLLDGTYEIQRPFIMMTQSGTQPTAAAQAFIDFTLSPEARDIISGAGVLQMR